jgi:hypothetical protein
MDQSKKTMRHFYCRDVMWETFELMANDFDCSIDYLINEAMRFYARSKNYQAPATSVSGVGPATSLPIPPGPPIPPGAGGGPTIPQGQSIPPQPPASRPPPPPPPSFTRPPPAPPPAPSVPAGKAPAEPGAGPMLYLIFNQQKLPVDKDQFIIGRGSKTSDLAIKDGNISRKHAAVIRRNGVYYIKDLGSTNGIDYKGMRIDNKRIDEGDVFHICDYELRFTYQ